MAEALLLLQKDYFRKLLIEKKCAAIIDTSVMILAYIESETVAYKGDKLRICRL